MVSGRPPAEPLSAERNSRALRADPPLLAEMF